jgi:hypothetical protein
MKPQGASTKRTGRSAPANGVASRTLDVAKRPSRGTKRVQDHPLAPVVGSFVDDPFWDEFQKAIKENRREVDEQAR